MLLHNVSLATSAADVTATAAWRYLCASTSLHVAVHALLDERSALLSSDRRENADALELVLGLVERLVCDPAARTPFLHAAPDRGCRLVVLLAALLKHHPQRDEPSVDGAKPLAVIATASLQPLVQAAKDGDADAIRVTRFTGDGHPDDVIRAFASRCGWLDPSARATGSARAPAARPRATQAGGGLTGEMRVLDTAPRCAACERQQGPTDAPFQKCGCCRAATYCGRECQRNHWPQHKRTCVQRDGAQR
jgi:hypothetical protein